SYAPEGPAPGPAAATSADAAMPTFSPAEGGALSGAGGGVFAMIGDQGPFSIRQTAGFPQPPQVPRPFPPSQPPNLPNPRNRSQIAPSVRSFKIADNQSPFPQDRIFFTFNYFDNVNARLN